MITSLEKDRRHSHGFTCCQSQWASKDVPKDSNWLRGWYSQGFICCQSKWTSFWPTRCEIKVTTYTGRYTGILTLCPQLLTAWVTWTQLKPSLFSIIFPIQPLWRQLPFNVLQNKTLYITEIVIHVPVLMVHYWSSVKHSILKFFCIVQTYRPGP